MKNQSFIYFWDFSIFSNHQAVPHFVSMLMVALPMKLIQGGQEGS